MRVSAEALKGGHATWSESGIRKFLSARRAGISPSRSALELFSDVECAVRARVELPDDNGYALVACFVMVTHVYRAFHALPVLFAVGPPQSGKSELADVVASLGFNGSLLGHATSASMTRLAEFSGGLIVLDDCESLGATGVGSDDLRRLLRVGYKVSTARKSVVEHTGRVRMVDLFGPRMVTNVSGADEALLSAWSPSRQSRGMISRRRGGLPCRSPACGRTSCLGVSNVATFRQSGAEFRVIPNGQPR